MSKFHSGVKLTVQTIYISLNGIAHYQNELFISDAYYTLYAYTVTGQFLRELYRDNKGKTLFFSIYNMAVSKNLPRQVERKLKKSI